MDAGILLVTVCGAVIGLSLAFFGGGGSILSVPMLLYVVGLRDIHVAIGTSGVAVALNALINLGHHGMAGNVRWRHATPFAATGVIGAAAGSLVGKLIYGPYLQILFAGVMVAAGVVMLNRRYTDDTAAVAPLDRAMLLRLIGIGGGAGLLAGLLGIGGGFLIVPGLVLATRMPMLNAVASSLLSVAAFGATTAFSYALSGLVDWPVAILFIAGGAAGGWIGTVTAARCAIRRGIQATIFATCVFCLAGYMVVHTFQRVLPGTANPSYMHTAASHTP